ncbi:MAG: HisA/HisF-related TIM barrel protein [Gammaproteobacteria bacterium]
MKIIPVIDLKDGVVVHARHGNRDQYRPIRTPLCQSSDIHRVILAFLELHDFGDFYIADLNAISHQGNHDRLISEVTALYPEKVFWIDRGCRPKDLPETLPSNHLTVLGSESLLEEDLKRQKSLRRDFVLSLDHSSSGALGPQSLFTDPAYWPDTLIIMTLARVGSGRGPDFDRLKAFRRGHPDKQLAAAGGIRNKQDLADLKTLGIEQALVASALHAGTITRDDLAGLAGA